jgi:hypothetical protein
MLVQSSTRPTSDVSCSGGGLKFKVSGLPTANCRLLLLLPLLLPLLLVQGLKFKVSGLPTAYCPLPTANLFLFTFIFFSKTFQVQCNSLYLPQ